ncbi:MAG: hypothetical protein ACR2QH_17895 [Geminicoccaceae bacterium]
MAVEGLRSAVTDLTGIFNDFLIRNGGGRAAPTDYLPTKER